MDQSKMAFLQSVLRYSTSHTEQSPSQPEIAEGEKNSLREISPERKKWLSQALDSISVNPVDELKKCIKVLECEQETHERKIEALETLKDWCEDMNFAIDFHKINGYKLLSTLLNDNNSEIRALICELIGTLAQNNPYCQETLINAKYLPILFYKLDKDSDDVKVKAMFAISCILRDYEEGQLKLMEGNALDILIKTINSNIEKIKIKCCFLLSSICSNKSIKDALTKKKLIQKLIELYRQSDHDTHEHVLSAINVLIDDNPQAIDQAKEMSVNFKQILTDRLQNISNDPRHDEERDMAKKIFQSLFQN